MSKESVLYMLNKEEGVRCFGQDFWIGNKNYRRGVGGIN